MPRSMICYYSVESCLFILAVSHFSLRRVWPRVIMTQNSNTHCSQNALGAMRGAAMYSHCLFGTSALGHTP